MSSAGRQEIETHISICGKWQIDGSSKFLSKDKKALVVLNSIQRPICCFSNRREKIGWGHLKGIEIACTNISRIPKH